MKAEGGEKGVKGWRRIYGTGREKMDGKRDLEGGGVTEWEGRRPNWDGGRGAPVEGKVKYINRFLKEEFKV